MVTVHVALDLEIEAVAMQNLLSYLGGLVQSSMVRGYRIRDADGPLLLKPAAPAVNQR